MSDTVIHRSVAERRRTLASIAAALVMHAVLFVIISIVADTGTQSAMQPPDLIDIQLESQPVVDSTPPNPQKMSPGATGGPAASAIEASGPASSAGPAAAVPAPGDGSAGGYVIPTPSGQAPDSPTPGPAGSSFRQAGGSAGSAQSLPDVQSPVPQAIIAAGQKGSGTGQGAAAGAVQRSGEGVLVPGRTGTGTSGNLDLSQLDKAIAGSGSGAGGTGASPGSAGTGQAGTGQGGTGDGGAGPKDYRVVWDQPDLGKGREVVSAPKPRIPQWVSTQGLSLKASVGFTLLPDGVVSSVTLEQSSGYADVDSAVLDAIRRWRFTAAKGATVTKGLIPYVIKAQE